MLIPLCLVLLQVTEVERKALLWAALPAPILQDAELNAQLPCNLHPILLYCSCLLEGKEKKKLVHKLKIFVLLPVATHNSDAVLTVLQINQEAQRPRNFPSRAGQHPLVGFRPRPAFCKYPLKVWRGWGCAAIPPWCSRACWNPQGCWHGKGKVLLN